MNVFEHPLFIAVFETPVPQVILEADPDAFTIVSYNDSFARVTKRENTILHGQQLFAAFDPLLNGTEGAIFVQDKLIEAILQRQVTPVPPHRYNLASPATGQIEEHWWEAQVKPVIIDDEVKYLHITFQDITDRFINGRLNVRGFHSERYFADLLNTIPAIAWTNDPAGEVTFYNKRWYDYTGLDFEQTRSWGWKTVIHPEDLDYNLKAYQEILDSEKEGSFEIREKGADGVYRWHLVKINPMRDDSGRIITWVGTAVDIQSLKEADQKKDEFLSIASHELKTPLTSIKAFNHLMLRYDDAARLSEFAQKSATHIWRLEKLIKDLLDVSRMNAGQMVYESTEFDFDELLQECVRNAQLTAPKHKVIVTHSEQIRYYGDAIRLEQVFNNLLTNAIKYSPAGGNVLVSSHIRQNGLIVAVKDEGIGIPQEHISKLFERYYRVDNTAMRFAGLGLGLFISSEIIKRHQGSLWLESEPGKGSTFYFRLPVFHLSKPETQDRDDYYSDTHGTMSYNHAESRVDLKWHGFQDLKSVQTICGKLLDMCVRFDVKKILADNTNVEGDTSEAVEWTATIYYPQLDQAGIRWLAWIESESTFNKLAAQKVIELVNRQVTTRFFQDEITAKAWLSSRE